LYTLLNRSWSALGIGRVCDGVESMLVGGPIFIFIFTVGDVYRNNWFLWGIYNNVYRKTPNIDNDEGLGRSLLIFLVIFVRFAIYTPV